MTIRWTSTLHIDLINWSTYLNRIPSLSHALFLFLVLIRTHLHVPPLSFESSTAVVQTTSRVSSSAATASGGLQLLTSVTSPSRPLKFTSSWHRHRVRPSRPPIKDHRNRPTTHQPPTRRGCLSAWISPVPVVMAPTSNVRRSSIETKIIHHRKHPSP